MCLEGPEVSDHRIQMTEAEAATVPSGRTVPAEKRGGCKETSPDEAEMNAQRAVHAGAVNTQENPVRDAGPTRVLGAAIEAGLGGRGEWVLVPSQDRCCHPRKQTLPALSRPPSAPGSKQGLSPTAPEPVCLPLTHFVGWNCAKPLKKSLDLGLARLRRHFLSFPTTTAMDGARRGPIPGQ